MRAMGEVYGLQARRANRGVPRRAVLVGFACPFFPDDVFEPRARVARVLTNRAVRLRGVGAASEIAAARREATEVIEASAMIWSLPAELSFTNTTMMRFRRV